MFSSRFQGLRPPPSFTSLLPRPHHQHPTVHITAQLVCPMDRPFGKHTPMPWSQCVYPNPLPPACLLRTQEVLLSVTDGYGTHIHGVLTHTLHTSPHVPQMKKHFTVSDSCWNDLQRQEVSDSIICLKDKHRSPFINLMKTRQFTIFLRRQKNRKRTPKENDHAERVSPGLNKLCDTLRFKPVDIYPQRELFFFSALLSHTPTSFH